MKLTRNQKGQGLVEYMILLALVVFVCVASARGLGSKISTRFKDMDKTIGKDLKINTSPRK